MIPRPAQYLLRFDDLCPTMSLSRWQRFMPLIEEFKIRPILAVVPDNQDENLNQSLPDPEFWDRMQRMEAAGATVALHGYHHVCDCKGKALVPLHRHSEFAGVPEEMQRRWIHAGLKILRDHGLDPRLWVAPRHGFDRGTLRALSQEGIRTLSDGFARMPFTRFGLTWIPQQLWAPADKSRGLWTICLHSNTAHGSQVNQLRDFLRRRAGQFTSVDGVLTESEPKELGLVERLYEVYAQSRAQASRARKRLPHRPSELHRG
jgi:predicted deacetylase